MEHQVPKVYKVYTNDDPMLTVAFSCKVKFGHLCVNMGVTVRQAFNGKQLAADGQFDRKFMFNYIFGPST